MADVTSGVEVRASRIRLCSMLLLTFLFGMMFWRTVGRPLIWYRLFDQIPIIFLSLAAFGAGRVRAVSAWIFLVVAADITLVEVVAISAYFNPVRPAHLSLPLLLVEWVVYALATVLAVALVKQAGGSKTGWRVARFLVGGFFAMVCVGLLAEFSTHPLQGPTPLHRVR